MRVINKIIIHTSDSPDDRDVDRAEIERWHKERGFDEIGYNFVIKRDGTVEIGRDIKKVPAHCKGQNLNSIGIVWCGRDKITDSQQISMTALVKGLLVAYDLKPTDVYGHSTFDKNKTCPRIPMDKFRSKL